MNKNRKDPVLKILEQRILLITLIIILLWLSLGDERDALSSMLGSVTSIFTIRIYEKLMEIMLLEKNSRSPIIYFLLMKVAVLGLVAFAVFSGVEERLVIAFLSGFLAFVPASLVMLVNPSLHFSAG